MPLTGCDPKRFSARVRFLFCLCWALVLGCATTSSGPTVAADTAGLPRLASPPRAQGREASDAELAELLWYIRRGWLLLERSPRDLLDLAQDPKFAPIDGRWTVYLPEGPERVAIEARLKTEVPPADLARIDLRGLPAPSRLPIPEPERPGLLYLPKPYLVPGGRFNEMYGWDSYFILRGLLRDGELERARNLVDNLIYEIEHYGMVLNANRSYYLSRSQPPLLGAMVLAVYQRLRDRAWLSGAARALERYYAYYTEPPHLVTETGLSRYFDLGQGPATEVLASERDEQGRTHYDRVKAWLATHARLDPELDRFYDRQRDALTELFYVADRSMRESGYDPSNRFGPFNLEVIDYHPVCLNSLLYQMEQDAAEMARILGDDAAHARWVERAKARASRIHHYLWDPEEGLFLDYDYRHRRRRNYPFATTFFPLWVGVASRAEARELVPRALGLLETRGGIRTSSCQTGNQWDAPFGWAPLQLVAVEGLRAYGYAAEADRISINFLSLVLKEFIQHRTIFEKYDVEARSSQVARGIRFGYSSNQIGFGWTNAVFVVLYDALPESRRSEVRRLEGIPIPVPARRPIPGQQEGRTCATKAVSGSLEPAALRADVPGPE